MKIKISAIFIALFICFTSVAISEKEGEIENIEELWVIEFVRADLRETREKFINTMINLTPEQEKIFNPIFKEYEAKFKKLSDERRDIILDFDKNYTSMTNDKANEIAKRSIKVRKERLALMEEYYKKFSKALDPIVATRFLQLENYINLIVDIQIAQEIPLIEKK